MMETKEEILKKAMELYDQCFEKEVFTDFFETLSFISSLLEDGEFSSLEDALDDTRKFFGNPFMETETYEEFEDILCEDNVSPEIIFYIISEVQAHMLNELINGSLSQNEVNILLDTLDDKYLSSSIAHYSEHNASKISEYLEVHSED